ncbi:MAG: Lrp/AsnC family transcriptional regulator [Chloroflexota bacterium]|nr:Lrp/AsnC family transcriptional regulator [Chloroflexota bacterium]
MARLVNDTDRLIIRLLQQDARMSYAEVSRATDIPESTVRRRMDRLQQRGVIEFAMLADPSRLGYDLRVMIGLKVELHQLEEIAATLQGMDEVTFAAFLTGNFDIMIHVVVRSQEGLVRFLTKRLAHIPGIRSVDTFVMPYIIKPASAWRLPEGRSPEQADEQPPDELDGEETPRPRPRRRDPNRPRRSRRGRDPLAAERTLDGYSERPEPTDMIDDRESAASPQS